MYVYINNRDHLTWLRQGAAWFAQNGHEVIIIDNASTYEPLLDWYSTCDYVVHRLRENVGHLAPWQADLVDNRDHYAVTDPDLSYQGIPSDWGHICIEGFRRGAEVKVGFSLDETLIPSTNPAWQLDEFCLYPLGNHPDRWSPGLKVARYYRVPIDTTFAVYKPRVPFRIGGWRIERPYTARHLPWHIVLQVNATSPALQIPMNDEIYYYFSHASSSSCTKPRLQRLLSQYVALRRCG